MAAPANSATTVPTNYSGKLVGGYGYSNGRKGLILGDMSMQVDFDTGDLTGSVTNLAANMEASGASPEVLVSGGSLTLDADYVTAANRYEGTLSGSVNLPKSNGEEDVNKVDIDSDVRAVLYGPTGATEPNAISARFDSPAALPSDIDYLAGTLHAE